MSHAIQTHEESHGYGVVSDFFAHGIGPSIHEEPNFPHYGLPRRGLRLKEGMILLLNLRLQLVHGKLRRSLTVGLHVPDMGATVLNMSILLQLQKIVLSL